MPLTLAKLRQLSEYKDLLDTLRIESSKGDLDSIRNLWISTDCYETK